MEQQLLPAWPDAARALSITRSKIFLLTASGDLRSVKIGRRRLIPVSAIREYVERLERGAA
jgi:excisionase family DNA binding protein